MVMEFFFFLGKNRRMARDFSFFLNRNAIGYIETFCRFIK